MALNDKVLTSLLKQAYRAGWDDRWEFFARRMERDTNWELLFDKFIEDYLNRKGTNNNDDDALDEEL